MNYALIYFVLVNLISGIFFFADKAKSKRNETRIPEKTLHTLELMGGVFSIAVLMSIIKHKNRKPSYYILTYLILTGWMFLAFYFVQPVNR